MIRRIPVVLLLICISGAAAAQSNPNMLQVPLPKALVIPNYDNVLVGKDQTLESGAYIARTADSSANFYNPAGLVNGDKTSINASSSGWVSSRLSSVALDRSVTSSKIDNVPGYFGILFGGEFAPRNLRFGISLTRTVAWSPGALDLATPQMTGGTLNQLTLATASSFQSLLYQAAVAWSPVTDRSLRLGFSFGFADTSYTAQTSLGGLLTIGGQPAQFTGALRANGDSTGLLLGVGLQWDVVGGLTLGVLARSPGIRLGSSSLVTYQASVLQPQASSSSYFRDDTGAFEYKLPVEVGVGVAYNFGPAQLEADMRYHNKVNQYDFYNSTQPIQIVTQNANGTTSGSTTPGPVVPYAARQVINGALGGNVKVGKISTLHAGFNTSLSPVADPGAAPFRQANLYGVTAGFDFQLDHFGFSLGAGYQWGWSAATPLDIAGQTVQGSGLKLETVSILYAISFNF